YIDASVGDRRGRIALVVELVDCEHFPLTARLQHRYLSRWADQKHFVVSRDGRGEILVDRSVQSSLLDYIARRGIKRDEDAAVVNHVEHALVKQRRWHLRHGLRVAPTNRLRGLIALTAHFDREQSVL